MKIFVYLILILSVFILFGCTANNKQLIGGQKDTNGCLGSAGYTYNETANACIKTFELDADQRKASGIVVGYIGYADGLNILEVISNGCDGCYTVTFNKNGERMKATMSDWKVTEVILV